MTAYSSQVFSTSLPAKPFDNIIFRDQNHYLIQVMGEIPFVVEFVK